MSLRTLVRSSLRRCGYDLHRLTRACGLKDAFAQQKALFALEGARTILDVGANIGQTTQQYRELFPDAVVYSFEPFPASLAELAKKFGGDPRVKPVPQAVGREKGEKTFFVNASPYTNSLLPGIRSEYIEPSGTIEVPVITLDEFCAREGLGGVDILKMDIQGGERAALEGAAEQLRRQSIAVVYTEVLFSPMYEGQAFYHDISALLYGHGYTLLDLYNFAYDARGHLAWGDAIFISPEMKARGGGLLPSPGAS